MGPSAVDRGLTSVRTAVAGLAVAVALLLLFRVPLVATFRAGLIVLAALEVLSFGRRALSSEVRARALVEVAVKLAILAAAYVMLSS